MKEQEKPPLPPYDLLYEGINLKEAIGDRGVRLLIPRAYIWGRQASREYENRKRRQIEEVLRNDENFLLNNPIIICAVPLGAQLLLAIIDGHHRNRYSGLYGISVMPCIVCTPEVMVEVINSNKPEDKKIDQGVFIEQLRRETAEALLSLPDGKRPTYFPTLNIDELKTRFAGF